MLIVLEVVFFSYLLSQTLEDIVIISLVNGRHFFCAVSASLNPADLDAVQREVLEPAANTEADSDNCELDYQDLYPSKDS